MSVEDLSISVSAVIFNSLVTFINFIPSLIGGLIVLVIGLIVAAVVYRVIIGTLKAIKLESFLARYKITQIEGAEVEWSEILAEVARWTIIIIFLIPTFQAWRLSAVNTIITRLVLYIPNVIVAIILAVVGLVFARIASKVAYNAGRSLGKDLAHIVSLVAQWSIVVFAGFLVLHQLGVAQELLRILFSGLVAMVALAGGLAFGFGGQDTAKSILNSIMDRFKKA